MQIAGMFLMELEHEAGLTRKTLERVTDGILEFKPHAKSMPCAILAGHLCEILDWGVTILNQDVFDMNPETYKPYKPASVTELVASFDKYLAAVKQALQTKSDAQMQAVWTMTINGKPFLSMPRAAVFRGWVLNHSIHHRAQLGVYLRLNNLPVPAIYGPSADEGDMGAA